jgi:hypothetical protein
MKHTCPVCGYPDLFDPPRTPKSGGGSYEICRSCGFQFGVTDDDSKITYDQWRKQWIEKGMIWRSNATKPPSGWNPKKQLQNIGINLP